METQWQVRPCSTRSERVVFSHCAQSPHNTWRHDSFYRSGKTKAWWRDASKETGPGESHPPGRVDAQGHLSALYQEHLPRVGHASRGPGLQPMSARQEKSSATPDLMFYRFSVRRKTLWVCSLKCSKGFALKMGNAETYHPPIPAHAQQVVESLSPPQVTCEFY